VTAEDAGWFDRFADDTDVSRPVLFRPTSRQDRVRLAHLRSSIPGLSIDDQIRDQLAGLIQSRHPHRQLSAAERVAAADRHRGSVPLDRYGVWVWYPWLKRLVHLLDEAEFVELRTSRNRYRITPDEEHVLVSKRIGVVGLSAGHAIATALALERVCGALRIADPDRLELSNLNRLRAGVHELGLAKVALTARAIAEIDPFLSIDGYPDGVHDGNVDAFLGDGGIDLLIEECDSLDVKLRVRERARELRIPVVMATSERGMVDVERFDLEPDRPLLHGLLGDLDAARVRDLGTAEKLPHVVRFLGGRASMSGRLRHSLDEVGRTIETWPQLASAVILNSGVVVDVCRRILLGQVQTSGRFFMDPAEVIRD
jgi:molybdopterin/thiamine biosynthesis adenylyltransferase